MIQQPITMTSKGTFTLPAQIRKALGVQAKGDKLMLTFHEQSKIVEISKGSDLKVMQADVTLLLNKKFPGGLPKLDMEKIRAQKHQDVARRNLDSVA